MPGNMRGSNPSSAAAAGGCGGGSDEGPAPGEKTMDAERRGGGPLGEPVATAAWFRDGMSLAEKEGLMCGEKPDAAAAAWGSGGKACWLQASASFWPDDLVRNWRPGEPKPKGLSGLSG